jgi:hypothetical protein
MTAGRRRFPSLAEEQHMQRRIPAALWVGLVALAGMTALSFLAALSRGNLPVTFAIVPNVAILLGLYAGHRWAYVALIAVSAISVLVLAARSPGVALAVAVVDSLAVVPVIMSTAYFWKRSGSGPPFCSVCGCSLGGLAEVRCPQCGRTIEPR